MPITEAVERACQQPTLLDALSWICVWESERAIRQALSNCELIDGNLVNQRASPDGRGWDTCFRVCINEVMEKWDD